MTSINGDPRRLSVESNDGSVLFIDPDTGMASYLRSDTWVSLEEAR